MTQWIIRISKSHTLKKAVIKEFEDIKEIVGIEEQQEKVKGQDIALPVYVRARDDLSQVLAT